ncbi:hypothetical protein AWC38_SpisGene4210 [Stylophora pistillata]|uniref:Uncharacterized protein n=1 Tax=Stylophora pistillata TaxID=50429 RepID=A0A2B4SM48_STYPI|nr:hypothetical protein AWC38_SpisGene4210 [Stylophora pistillata]
MLRKILEKQDEKLFFDGKGVTKKSELRDVVRKEFKHCKGIGARKLKHRLKKRFEGVSEPQLQKVLARSKATQKGKVERSYRTLRKKIMYELGPMSKVGVNLVSQLREYQKILNEEPMDVLVSQSPFEVFYGREANAVSLVANNRVNQESDEETDSSEKRKGKENIFEDGDEMNMNKTIMKMVSEDDVVLSNDKQNVTNSEKNGKPRQVEDNQEQLQEEQHEEEQEEEEEVAEEAKLESLPEEILDMIVKLSMTGRDRTIVDTYIMP